jgi:hypothetical protein
MAVGLSRDWVAEKIMNGRTQAKPNRGWKFRVAKKGSPVFAFVLSATSHSFQPPQPGPLHRVASSCNLSMNNRTFILDKGGCNSRHSLGKPSINSRQRFVALQSDTTLPHFTDPVAQGVLAFRPLGPPVLSRDELGGHVKAYGQQGCFSLGVMAADKDSRANTVGRQALSQRPELATPHSLPNATQL